MSWSLTASLQSTTSAHYLRYGMGISLSVDEQLSTLWFPHTCIQRSWKRFAVSAVKQLQFPLTYCKRIFTISKFNAYTGRIALNTHLLLGNERLLLLLNCRCVRARTRLNRCKKVYLLLYLSLKSATSSQRTADLLRWIIVRLNFRGSRQLIHFHKNI